MRMKASAGVALGAACLMSLAAMPGAQAQTGPGYYGPQTYQGNAYPNPAMGSYGPTTGNYAPQAHQGNAYPNSAMGSYGSPAGNYAPQTYQGSSSPTWSQGTSGSTYENYSMPPSTSSMGNTEVVTNGPQGSPPPNWSASQNVKQSERYTTLLEHDRAFREARMREECGPITDPQLHQSCIQSFSQHSPSTGNGSGYGSSATPASNRSNYGR